MDVTISTYNEEIKLNNIESVVPATDDFPQWAIYPEGGEDIIFYNSDLVNALHIHDPAGKASEKSGVPND